MKCNNIIIWAVFLTVAVVCGCNKADFLSEKPNTDIVQPETLEDLFMLLDNTTVMGFNGGLGHLAADEYEVSFEDWQTASATERNSYVWTEDLYGGESGIRDWDFLYKQVFYANNVLERLTEIKFDDHQKADFIKGWAMFARAYANYDLIRNFCAAYDENTADKDLGIPIRLTAGIDTYEPRSTLKDSFQQVIGDLEVAIALLPRERPFTNLNRPSKLAGYALLARIYLDMRQYNDAALYADSALSIYDKLIDYNTISQTSATPFGANNDELILNAQQVVAYGVFSITHRVSSGKIPSEMIKLYDENDLRLKIFFDEASDGSYTRKRGYTGSGNYIFEGLATDELYLIKAECLARDDKVGESLLTLNRLVRNRYDNSFEYIPITASSGTEALDLVLRERRKQLNWRGTRWTDLKRLNKEGRNIKLTRSLDGRTYELASGSPRYVFPIPDDEITRSKIIQNKR